MALFLQPRALGSWHLPEARHVLFYWYWMEAVAVLSPAGLSPSPSPSHCHCVQPGNENTAVGIGLNGWKAL